MKDLKDMTIAELELELEHIETRIKELNRKKRAILFKQYPREVREIMKKLGWAPEDEGKVIRRTGGSLEIKR